MKPLPGGIAIVTGASSDIGRVSAAALVEPVLTKNSVEAAELKPDAARPKHDGARAGKNLLLRQLMETADPPELVTRTVVSAATARRPKHRSPAGKTARQITIARRFVTLASSTVACARKSD